MTVCATMIVKNEEAVLRRCLDSLVGIVDRASIVDTGSTDATVKIIGEFKGFPITLHQRLWRGFGPSRTEAIDLARGDGDADYLLRVDADQTISGELPDLIADAYSVAIHHGTLRYRQPVLFRTSMPWRYVGATHEYLACDAPFTTVDCDSLIVTEHADSSRRASGAKLADDLAALEQQFKIDPFDARNVFYLARTYEDAGRCNDAILHYRLRAGINRGYGDEVFYSLFRIAALTDDLCGYLCAWQLCPHRWEPVYHACLHFRTRQLYASSYALSTQAMRVNQPVGLFVSAPVYDYLLLFEHSISAHYVGEYAEAVKCGEELLRRELPSDIRAAVERNLQFPRKMLARA